MNKLRNKIAQSAHQLTAFDPKGDADLMKRVVAEAKRAGRSDEIYIFHLGSRVTSPIHSLS